MTAVVEIHEDQPNEKNKGSSPHSVNNDGLELSTLSPARSYSKAFGEYSHVTVMAANRGRSRHPLPRTAKDAEAGSG